MKFVDEAFITVHSGKGGAGAVSFRREKFIPFGGPDGGDGGRGGDVFIKADSGLSTLSIFQNKSIFRAGDGKGGGGTRKRGKDGDFITITVPPGTIIYNRDSGEEIADLTKINEPLLLAKGGRGGKGNEHFKSSTFRAPKFAQPGEPGETLNLRLELQLLADVGLLGYPNAGKSTLLSRISEAKPKIADYPFTTLSPMLGVVSAYEQVCVVADIPGLIEGAHLGRGLGIHFLRHLKRTRKLLHLIDISDANIDMVNYRFNNIMKELREFDVELSKKQQTILLTKIDTIDDISTIRSYEENFRKSGFEVLSISAITGKGINSLLQTLFRKDAL
ncbi:MAG: hypothetical protein A3F16_04260 [Deltaproteobacteria bacterium RIFCSPHIGHO2_12_FULL_43_9]|nr:MAG: hypothetical protein A3F16_04260 [Deltaproteobacteria bacterium RIFCSPHIGHO2_12_FULL_43_9]